MYKHAYTLIYIQYLGPSVRVDMELHVNFACFSSLYRISIRQVQYNVFHSLLASIRLRTRPFWENFQYTIVSVGHFWQIKSHINANANANIKISVLLN